MNRISSKRNLLKGVPNELVSQPQAKLIQMEKLIEHEEVDLRYLNELKEEIESDGFIKRPIVVDKNTNIILDGEHRFNSLKELGCSQIPVIFVDYNSCEIEVESWENRYYLTKQTVIKAGLTQEKLPSKTSKHLIRIGNKLKHISSMQTRIDVPLSILRRRVKEISG